MSNSLNRVLTAGVLTAALLSVAACGEADNAGADTQETPDVNAETTGDVANGNADVDTTADAGVDTDNLTDPVSPTPDETADESMPILAHKDWSAFVNAMPGPGPRNRDLIVTGQVQLGVAGQGVSLKIMEPQGINPAILMLEVDIEEKIGAQVLTWYDVRLEVPTDQSAYTEVSILWKGEMLATVPIMIAH
jgi:hypothetical protein